MDRYKPGFMGKVMPVNNISKMTDFVVNKYDSFSKCYDAAKEHSESIKDVSSVETNEGSTEFSMKLSTDSATVIAISEETKDDSAISVHGDVITAKA